MVSAIFNDVLYYSNDNTLYKVVGKEIEEVKSFGAKIASLWVYGDYLYIALANEEFAKID